MKITSNDQHHCYCFSIDPDDIEDFKEELKSLGFTYELEEDHGQVFGLALRVEEQLQLHIKVMLDGKIEGEMEPPPAYPIAHLNPEHSYSAHQEIGQVLNQTSINFKKKLFPPMTCIRRVIKKPEQPTHAKTFAVAGLALGALYYLLKDDDKKDDY